MDRYFSGIFDFHFKCVSSDTFNNLINCVIVSLLDSKHTYILLLVGSSSGQFSFLHFASSAPGKSKRFVEFLETNQNIGMKVGSLP